MPNNKELEIEKNKKNAKDTIAKFNDMFVDQVKNAVIREPEREQVLRLHRGLVSNIDNFWKQPEADLIADITRRFTNADNRALVIDIYEWMNDTFEVYSLSFLKNLQAQQVDPTCCQKVVHLLKSIPRLLVKLLTTEGWDEIAIVLSASGSSPALTRVKAIFYGILAVPLVLGVKNSLKEVKEAISEIEAVQKNNPERSSLMNKMNVPNKAMEAGMASGILLGVLLYLLSQVSAAAENKLLEQHNITNTESHEGPIAFSFAELPTSVQIQLAAVCTMMFAQLPGLIRAGTNAGYNIYQAIANKVKAAPRPETETELQASVRTRQQANDTRGIAKSILQKIPFFLGQGLLFWVNTDILRDIIMQNHEEETSAGESAKLYLGLGFTVVGIVFTLLAKDILPHKGSSTGGSAAKKLLPRPDLQYQEELVTKSTLTLTQIYTQSDDLLKRIQQAKANANTTDWEKKTLEVLEGVMRTIKNEEVPEAYRKVDATIESTRV
jgi:hypothetical protein